MLQIQLKSYKEEFFASRSMPINRELMRVFRDLKLVEQLGSGIHRILKVYDKSIFKISDNFLEISFPFEGGYEGSQKGGQINSLTTRQQEVLEIIIENNTISRSQLADKLGINESAIQKHLKALTDKEIIERVGTKGGYWKILLNL